MFVIRRCCCDFSLLPRVLTLLATRASSLHNPADISRGISIPQSTLRRYPQSTLRRYLTLLEATFLLTPIPAWSSNLGRRMIKAPKLALLSFPHAGRTRGVLLYTGAEAVPFGADLFALPIASLWIPLSS